MGICCLKTGGSQIEFDASQPHEAAEMLMSITHFHVVLMIFIGQTNGAAVFSTNAVKWLQEHSVSKQSQSQSQFCDSHWRNGLECSSSRIYLRTTHSES